MITRTDRIICEAKGLHYTIFYLYGKRIAYLDYNTFNLYLIRIQHEHIPKAQTMLARWHPECEPKWVDSIVPHLFT